MNDSQSAICQIILSMLEYEYFRKNIKKNECFKYIFKNTIRQYAEINSDNIKTYDRLELLIKHHKFSVRAYRLLCKELNCEESINHDELIENINNKLAKSNKKILKKLHREHITPISIIVNKLLKINELTLGAVIGIMQENEVIVLTKEESKVLDGSVNNIYPLDGFTKNGAGMQKKGTRLERLNKLYEFGTEIHKNTINNTLG